MGIKHTPGPWFITGTMTKYIEARIPGRMIQEVAACGPTAADDGYGEQQMANARLIAAAPELLEALEALSKSAPSAICSDFNHKAGDFHEHDEACPPLDRYEVACLAARAAIAKAKGEEQ